MNHEEINTIFDQTKYALISVTWAGDRLIFTRISDPEKIRQIMENPIPGKKTVKFHTAKHRGVKYKINSHFTAETTITERVGNILSNIVSTSNCYGTDPK